ncbi:MAG TPA: MOFRL family protein, partial [Gemmatimonadaceae bacterium]
GETTVTLPADARGTGGRCQELALSAARLLGAAGHEARGVTLLAAGTDGRDGPTDAAGAVVSAATWRCIGEAGVDAAAALAGHDAHTALGAAGALLRTGATGTNVRDVVVGLVTL